MSQSDVLFTCVKSGVGVSLTYVKSGVAVSLTCVKVKLACHLPVSELHPHQNQDHVSFTCVRLICHLPVKESELRVIYRCQNEVDVSLTCETIRVTCHLLVSG